MNIFEVRLTDTWISESTAVPGGTVTVEAFEADIVDGVLAFSGVNQGGYVAAFADGQWVSFRTLPR